jgi:hypothetical protein
VSFEFKKLNTIQTSVFHISRKGGFKKIRLKGGEKSKNQGEDCLININIIEGRRNWMKKLRIILIALLFLGFGVSSVSATAVLYDWGIDVAGNYYNAADTYLPPTIGGEITGVTGFNMITPAGDPYGFPVPEAIGSVEVTYDPGVAGDYAMNAFFDVEIDEWINTYFNESGATHGIAGGGIDGAVTDDFGDIVWDMSWDFSLTADQYAVATFFITDDVDPGTDFYLSQTDDDTNETIYLTSTLDIRGGVEPVPEPGTMLLLGTGILGLFGLGRKKFKK